MGMLHYLDYLTGTVHLEGGKVVNFSTSVLSSDIDKTVERVERVLKLTGNIAANDEIYTLP